MPDVNNVVVHGPIVWWCNWEPKQWGGVIALKIKVPGVVVPSLGTFNESTIFAKVSYQAADAQKPKVTGRLLQLQTPGHCALITESKIVHREKDGKYDYSLQVNLHNLKLTPTKHSMESFSQVSLYGKCISVQGEWCQLALGYRNPKLTTQSYRYVTVHLNGHDGSDMAGQWMYVEGLLLNGGHVGQENTLVVVAQRVI